MSQTIAIGICAAPEQAPRLAPIYDYIELSLSTVLDPLQDDPAFASQMAMLESLAMPARACNNFVNSQVKLVGPGADWDEVELYVERAFARAQALGIERIVFGSGGARMVPEGYSRAKAWGQLVRFCNLCADRAYEELIIAIEPLNRGECNIINTFTEALQLARDVDRPEIRVLADIYHFEVESEPLEDIREGADWLEHVHLADSGRLYPGSGSYPLFELFELLHDIGYDERASVECRWGDDFYEEAESAAAFLRHMA